MPNKNSLPVSAMKSCSALVIPSSTTTGISVSTVSTVSTVVSVIISTTGTTFSATAICSAVPSSKYTRTRASFLPKPKKPFDGSSNTFTDVTTRP